MMADDATYSKMLTSVQWNTYIPAKLETSWPSGSQLPSYLYQTERCPHLHSHRSCASNKNNPTGCCYCKHKKRRQTLSSYQFHYSNLHGLPPVMLTRTWHSRPRTRTRTRHSRPRTRTRTRPIQGQGPGQGPDPQGQGPGQGPDTQGQGQGQGPDLQGQGPGQGIGQL